MPLAVALGLAIVGIGFNSMHGANHEAYSERRWVNRMPIMTLDLVGGSSHFSRSKHNVFHHTFVNVVGHDTDVNLVGLGRLTLLNRPAGWLLGGLNFQIEHHLSSGMCHVNYRAIAPVVERACRDFGIAYKHNATLASVVRSHYRWLRAMGRPAELAVAHRRQ